MVIFSNCTDRHEEELKNFTVSISNISNETILIKGYDKNNLLSFEYLINSMNKDGEINYSSVNFSGYINKADSISIKFQNNKGYICDLRQSNNNLCFTYKNLLVGNTSYFNEINNNHFEFEINQTDFENALDLP